MWRQDIGSSSSSNITVSNRFIIPCKKIKRNQCDRFEKRAGVESAGLDSTRLYIQLEASCLLFLSLSLSKKKNTTRGPPLSADPISTSFRKRKHLHWWRVPRTIERILLHICCTRKFAFDIENSRGMPLARASQIPGCLLEDRAREKCDFDVILRPRNSTAIVGRAKEGPWTLFLATENTSHCRSRSGGRFIRYGSPESFFLNTNSVWCTLPPINIAREFIIVRDELQSLELLRNLDGGINGETGEIKTDDKWLPASEENNVK